MMKIIIVLILASLSLSVYAEDVCKSAASTIEVNRCADLKLDVAKLQLAKYFNESLKSHADDALLIENMKSSQGKWESYISSHCESVYIEWRVGTIRGLKEISCEMRLTNQRTHEIWLSFLKNNESSILTEPN